MSEVHLIYVLIVGLLLAFGYVEQFACNVVGFAYPAIESLKTISGERPSYDAEKWLTYWIVYSLFGLLEIFPDIVGSLPSYWPHKYLFVVWLMMPSDLNGSRIIYERLVRPFLGCDCYCGRSRHYSEDDEDSCPE